MPQWFSGMCLPKLFLPHKIIRMFGPKTAIFAPKYSFICTYRPCLLIWCILGRLVGGCGARAVSRKTLIHFILCIFFHLQMSRCISGWMTLYMPMAQYITAKVIATTGLTKCAKIVACRSLRSVFAPCSSAFLAIS